MSAAGPTTADRFREFAGQAAAGGSPLYAEWALGIAGDPGLVDLVEGAPASKRQPVLALAVCRILGAPEGSFSDLRRWLLSNGEAFVAELSVRFTQTNDVRRAGPVAVALAEAGIEGPVALLEVGASAGLGLFPDRFAISVSGSDGSVSLGDSKSPVALRVAVDGVACRAPHPTLPQVVARVGLDLEPVDVVDPLARRWLETLLWPGQSERLDLLRAAFAIARQDPPDLIRGDAVDGLSALVDRAPVGATPVVITAGTLVYLPGARRQSFVDLVAASGARWVSYERTGLLTGVQATVPQDPAISSSDPAAFATLALDGVALALGNAHGTRLRRL